MLFHSNPINTVYKTGAVHVLGLLVGPLRHGVAQQHRGARAHAVGDGDQVVATLKITDNEAITT